MPGVAVTLVLITLTGTLLAWFSRTVPRSWRLIYCAVAATALIAQLAIVGPHWQMAPVYGSLVPVTMLQFRRTTVMVFSLVTAIILVCCFTSLGLLWALPIFQLPAPTGPYAVGTTGPVSWTDETRNLDGSPRTHGQPRELVLQIWYPAPAGWQSGWRARYARFRELSLIHSYQTSIRTNSRMAAPVATDGPAFPVLLFGHRWGGNRNQDTFLAEDLASHGYVVVAIDHPLNSARVQLANGSVVKSDRAKLLDNIEATTAAAILAAWSHELDIWTADDQFVLAKLQQSNAGRFSNRLDLTRVGAFGHSFGGASSTALLGVEPRVQCAINLDGWTFQGLDHRTTQPILLVYEGSEEVRHPEVGEEGKLDTFDFNAVDTSLQRFGGLRAYVSGTQHLDFTDQTLVSPFQRITYTGPIAGDRIRTITRGLVLGFFDANLKHSGQIPNYPEVKLETWPAH